jgi:2-polyprenyl-6-methoxyphenol hydroxylase-like FAD-dependent oxidoreductase
VKIIVIGGSIAGLSAGIALRCKGFDVDIFERSPEAIETRGAGLVIQPDLANYVHEHNIAQPEVLGVSNDITQILDRTDGSSRGRGTAGRSRPGRSCGGT